MPLYEYRCERCRKVFEAYKRLSEPADSERCPSCGSPSPKTGLSVFRTGGGSGSGASGGSACGGGSRRSPFG